MTHPGKLAARSPPGDLRLASLHFMGGALRVRRSPLGHSKTTATDDCAEYEGGVMSAQPMTAKPEFVPQPKAIWSLWDISLIGFVVLIAVTAALIALRQYQHRRVIERVVGELRSATPAFREYIQEHKTAPEPANFGEAPKSATPFLAQLNWGQPTPVGGFYRWLGSTEKKSKPGDVISGRIGIAAFSPAPPISLTDADLLEIDQRIDDGDLAAGDFRIGFNGWPVLTVRSIP